MTGALVARKVDFALAAMGSWFQLFKYFSFSISIQWIGITTLTPKPKYVLNVSSRKGSVTVIPLQIDSGLEDYISDVLRTSVDFGNSDIHILFYLFISSTN